METRINGLLTCDQCGASVTEEATETHLGWHKEVDEAFTGAARLISTLAQEIVQLKHKE
jgi:hypothetical protein